MIEFSLYKIQNAFQAYLDNQAPESAYIIENLIIDTTQISAARRLEIYYNAYRLRLLEILKNDFPKVHTLMGDKAFKVLGRLYIAAYPSQHFSTRYFGQRLAQFLNEESAYVKQPYLAEMAHFEWALANTLDAADESPITLDYLKSVPPEQWGYLKIRFHPSLHLCNSDWDIPELWKAIEHQKLPQSPQKQKGPLTWICWRAGLQSQFRSLTKPQALILRLLKTDHDFADVCESLTEIIDSETIPTVVLGFIQQCIQDGLVTGVRS